MAHGPEDAPLRVQGSNLIVWWLPAAQIQCVGVKAWGYAQSGLSYPSTNSLLCLGQQSWCGTWATAALCHFDCFTWVPFWAYLVPFCVDACIWSNAAGQCNSTTPLQRKGGWVSFISSPCMVPKGLNWWPKSCSREGKGNSCVVLWLPNLRQGI